MCIKRLTIYGLLTLAALFLLSPWAKPVAANVSNFMQKSASPPVVPPTFVSVRLLDGKGELTAPVSVPRVEKSDHAWRAQLTDEQYRVTRAQGTERAFCGIFHDNHLDGVYSCVGCGLPLFRSKAKFESGTGWPSFFQPIAEENVASTTDDSYGMIRTEIHCARCGSHLGHVFTDGPAPTHLRFCMNSAALSFRPDGHPPAREKVLFGAGCFWGVEAAFAQTHGVTHTRVGYAGGLLKNPTYEDVCGHATGHAETVEVEYDPAQISFEALLAVFWKSHNPAAPHVTGPEHGGQYRSAVFFTTPEQETEIRQSAADLEKTGKLSGPVTTEIALAPTFYPAEDYHQQYYLKHSLQSCRIP